MLLDKWGAVQTNMKIKIFHSRNDGIGRKFTYLWLVILLKNLFDLEPVISWSSKKDQSHIVFNKILPHLSLCENKLIFNIYTYFSSKKSISIPIFLDSFLNCKIEHSSNKAALQKKFSEQKVTNIRMIHGEKDGFQFLKTLTNVNEYMKSNLSKEESQALYNQSKKELFSFINKNTLTTIYNNIHNEALTNKIGIHLRGGDLLLPEVRQMVIKWGGHRIEINISTVLNYLKELDSKFFICTDTKDFEELFMAKFPNSTKFSKNFSQFGIIHTKFFLRYKLKNKKLEIDCFREALQDMIALGHCKEIIGNASSFSLFGAIVFRKKRTLIDEKGRFSTQNFTQYNY